MASTEANPLTLTTADQVFVFSDFEVPPELHVLGGEQLHAVHQFIGGNRTIQTYGAVPHHVITWSGLFLGQGTEDRALQLDSIRSSGESCTLTWNKWKYTGILSKLGIRPGFSGHIPYEATFTPDTDLSGSAPFTAAVSPEAAYSGTAAALTTLGSSYGGSAPAILGAIAAVTSSLNAVSTLQANNGGSISAIPATSLAPIATTLNNLATQLAALEVPVILPAAPYAMTVAAIDSNYADALWVQAEVVQLTALLYVLSLPTQVRNIQTFVNPNLLLIAAAVYGDPNQYQLISNANGGFPLVAQGTFTLVLPSVAS